MTVYYFICSTEQLVELNKNKQELEMQLKEAIR